MTNQQSCFSDVLFEKNHTLFKSVFKNRLDEICLERVLKLRDETRRNLVEEGPAWKPSKEYILMASRFIPSSEELAKVYGEVSKDYEIGANISQYIGELDGDPHLFQAVLRLRNAISESDFDPNSGITTTDGIRPHFLIALGTGDGTELISLLDRFQPSHLFIAVQEWDQFISSFWIVDWPLVWKSFTDHPLRSISIGRYETSTAILSSLSDICLPGMEHSLVYRPHDGLTSSENVQVDLTSKHYSSVIDYLGFTLDEYNMVWDTWQSLKRSPRVYRRPIKPINARCVVCGSGPSLDAEIENIKALQSTHIIIACASNFRTLRAHGIEVDFLAFLERGHFMVEDYKETIMAYGAGNTRLIASATSPAGLQDLFDDTAVYFRPALTPLAIFSDSPNEVLTHEGPQTVNTGIALAAALRAEEVVLVGVDLGVRSLDKPRSQEAAGVSPRTFNQDKPANFGGTVFTDRYLIDSQIAMEVCIASSPQMTVWNASDGIAIKGANPISLSQYIQNQRLESSYGIESRKAISQWWNGLSRFKPDRFTASWTSRRPRLAISDLFRPLKQLYEGPTPWFPSVLIRVTELLSLNVPPREQFPRRMIRAVILKLTVAVTRQLMVMSRDSKAQDQFGEKARNIIVELIVSLEKECYQLCDELERLDPG